MSSESLTIAEAAQRTGLSKKALANRVDRGQLRVFKSGGVRRIPLSELARVGLLDQPAPEAPPPSARVDRLLSELDRLAVELRVAVATERERPPKA